MEQEAMCTAAWHWATGTAPTRTPGTQPAAIGVQGHGAKESRGFMGKSLGKGGLFQETGTKNTLSNPSLLIQRFHQIPPGNWE